MIASDTGSSGGFFPIGGPTLEEVIAIRSGPGGVYVLDSTDSGATVHRYSRQGNFLSTIIPAGSGGLEDVSDMVFGPTGDIFIANYETGQPAGDGGEVLRFSSTGTFLGVFAANGSGDGVNASLGEPMGLAFGPDGNLYVANDNSFDNVLRFNGTTGAFIDTFIPDNTTGLNDPKSIKFGPDGRFYASNEGGAVEVYNGTTGAYVGQFVTTGSGGLQEPVDMVFAGGSLWVLDGDDGAEAVYRYNATTGAFISATFLTPTTTFDDARTFLIATINNVPVPIGGLPMFVALALSLLGAAFLTLRRAGGRLSG
ncbi:MAG: hypothetical protein ABI585_08295 [Betaproteobacteria bacterium]